MDSTMLEEVKTKVEGELSDLENGNCSSSGSGGDTKKTCVDCGTSRTPLWRGGPAGPKSLCNACGIKSRKKRQAACGISQEDTKIKKKKKKTCIDNSLVLETPRIIKVVKPEPVNVVVKKKMIIKTYTDSCNGNKKVQDSESCNGNKKNVSRFLDLGFKVPVMKRSSIEKKRLWRKLGEEEQAAVLLMTLSCG